jgi:WD40 repeat protein
MPALLALVRDGRRFIMAYKSAIEKSPLQAYVSALLFSPTGSMIRNLFKREEPKLITLKPAMNDNWSPCLQTLEDHSGGVRSVAFSYDSARLASASNDGTVKIWNTGSGECLQTLEDHSGATGQRHSHTTQHGSRRRRIIRRSRFGTRAAASACRRLRAIAVQSC